MKRGHSNSILLVSFALLAMLVINVMELARSVKLNALLELINLKRERAPACHVHQNNFALKKECQQVANQQQSKKKKNSSENLPSRIIWN